MAQEFYPTDDLGMPLPVIIPRPPDAESKKARKWNRHHAWYYSGRFLLGTEGSRTVRFSRLQHMPVKTHNWAHGRYKQGLELPPTEYDEFKLTMLGCAGYISPEGLLVTKRGVQQIEINPGQKRELRRPGVFTIEKGSAFEIGEFLMGYAIKNGLGQVVEDHESRVSRFMEMPSGEEKEELALSIVREAAEVAVEPLDFFYAAARSTHSLKTHAPRTPRRLMMGHIKHTIPDLQQRLHATLEEQIYGPVPYVAIDEQG